MKLNRRLTPWPCDAALIFPARAWPLARLTSHPLYAYWKSNVEGPQGEKDPPRDLWYAMNTILEPKNLQAFENGGAVSELREVMGARTDLLVEALVQCRVFTLDTEDFDSVLRPVTETQAGTPIPVAIGRPRGPTRCVAKAVFSVNMPTDLLEWLKDQAAETQQSVSKIVVEVLEKFRAGD